MMNLEDTLIPVKAQLERLCRYNTARAFTDPELASQVEEVAVVQGGGGGDNRLAHCAGGDL